MGMQVWEGGEHGGREEGEEEAGEAGRWKEMEDGDEKDEVVDIYDQDNVLELIDHLEKVEINEEKIRELELPVYELQQKVDDIEN